MCDVCTRIQWITILFASEILTSKLSEKKNGIKVQLHLKTQASVRNEMSGISYILRKFTSPSST